MVSHLHPRGHSMEWPTPRPLSGFTSPLPLRFPPVIMDCGVIAMANEPTEPYPKNAPGEFYVENDCCITCQTPCHEAPDLMAHNEDGVYPHCYFKRQPEAPVEVERAVMACVVSCVNAVRYAGEDPKILKRLEELRCKESCDVLVSRGPLARGNRPDRKVDEPPLPSPGSGRHPLWDRDLDG